ncbi:hypothetical protein EK904_004580 [Melospiza melodia maxima]|nr:hypothetical protein EK904_004580 [Melospiza melodia maxima]
MDSQCDCVEPPAAEQPSGRINKTAFKLFRRRKSGGTMPSIFGVRSRGGEGKGAGKPGMVRSRTHDGLADAPPAAAVRPPEELSGERPEPAAGEVGTAKDAAITGDIPITTIPPVEPHCDSGQETAAAPDPSSVDPPSEQSIDRICLMFADVTSLKSFDSLTGCGDIIADHEEDVGGGSGVCEKSTPGPSKLGATKKHPTMVAYQGGGEEMASPDQVDDTCLQEFWDMLSQTDETKTQGGGSGGGTKKPEGLKESRGTEGAQNRVVVKRGGLHQIAIHLNHKEEQKSREKEQHEGVPNSDEGYWDSTTPGPEEDSSTSIQKETLPRDSYSGDALYDLYAEPDENPPAGPTHEEVPSVPRSKPVSPITTVSSLKTPSSAAKDSKIPISIKHLSSSQSHPASHGADASNSHHVAHHHLAKSEMHRTKIPVSKVLVRRVSNRGAAGSVTGTTVKTATYQDSAKK